MPLTEKEAKAVMENVRRKGLPVGFQGGAYEAMMFGVSLALRCVPGMEVLDKKPADEPPFPPPAKPVPSRKRKRNKGR